MSDTQASAFEVGAFVQTAEVGELYAAIVAAFGDLANVTVDSKAEIPGKEGKRGFEYSYASLGAVMTAVRGPLSKAGLAIVQAPAFEVGPAGQRITVATRLIHKSGQWMEASVSIMCAQNAAAQVVGSALTYARRYGALSLLGIATSNDDDGKAANEAPGDAEQYFPRKQFMGMVGEAFGGDRDAAAAWWKENVDPAKKYFRQADLDTLLEHIELLAGATEQDTADTASDAPGADETLPGTQPPSDGENGPQTATRGPQEGRAAKARADVDLEVAQHLGVNVDQIIDGIQHMNVPDVRFKLSQAGLDSRGNADTIRKRLAEVLIREAIESAKAVAASDAPFTDDPAAAESES